MSKIRVAVVDDHGVTRTGIKSLLKRSAKTQWVGEAASGEEGLPLLQATQPDVAVIDILLPGMDGIELVRQFRDATAKVALPTKLMILSGVVHEDKVLEALAAGVDAYCVKTSQGETLLTAVQMTHAGDPWLDPAIARIVLKYIRQSHATAPPIANPLTEKELSTLSLMVQGYSNGQIANKACCSVATVKTHVRSILHKLGANDRTEAAVLAMRARLIR
jgi:DNA-binding NarL/FixJ family response regulator